MPRSSSRRSQPNRGQRAAAAPPVSFPVHYDAPVYILPPPEPGWTLSDGVKYLEKLSTMGIKNLTEQADGIHDLNSQLAFYNSQYKYGSQLPTDPLHKLAILRLLTETV